MIRKIALGGAMTVWLATAGALTAGELKVETTPLTSGGSDDAAPTVTLNLKDVDPATLIDELGKAARITIKQATEQQLDSSSNIRIPLVYDFALEKVPIDVALDRAGRLIERQVSYQREQRMATFTRSTPYGLAYQMPSTPPTDDVRFELRSVSCRRSLGRGEEKGTAVGLAFSITNVPWLERVNTARFEADEVVTDNGVKVVASIAGAGNATPGRWRFQPDGISLQLPDPPPKIIKLLRGRFILLRVDAIETLRVNGLSDGNEVTGDAWGCKFTVGPVARDGDRITLPLKIERGKSITSNETWVKIVSDITDVANRPQITTAKGEAFLPGGGGGRRSDKMYEGEIRVGALLTSNPNGTPNDAGAGKANERTVDGISFQRPSKVTEVTVPIELKDLVLP